MQVVGLVNSGNDKDANKCTALYATKIRSIMLDIQEKGGMVMGGDDSDVVRPPALPAIGYEA